MKALLLVSLLGCSSAAMRGDDPTPDAPPAPSAPDAQPSDEIRYPDPDWDVGPPASAGIDPAALAAAATAAAPDSYCLLVIRHGVLVSESYFNGATATTTPSSWSIAKSYTSTTVGIALGAGALPGLDAKIADAIPSWAGDRGDITLHDLVTMQSGLAWSIFSDYIAMAEFAPDKSAYATGLDAAHPAGSAWLYHNGGVQMIEPYFRAVTGTSIEDYARAHLWTPIGMTATWAHDSANHPTTYANVLATCRDHARLGYLYLHGGRWKSQQVVPASWVAAALAPSQPYNQGYGYLWWLNGHQPTISSTGTVKDAPLAAWAPPDLFAARGFGGQFIDVIPSLDMVIVRFARDPTAMTSTDPATVAQALYADEVSDRHQDIVAPILAGTH